MLLRSSLADSMPRMPRSRWQWRIRLGCLAFLALAYGGLMWHMTHGSGPQGAGAAPKAGMLHIPVKLLAPERENPAPVAPPIVLEAPPPAAFAAPVLERGHHG
ncbi:hypothetical protein OQ496_02820 [Acetobacter suratthaniensis]|jgi:hypothetical protein|uniref:Uncharacterized protein n=1 Tax=Acetobacter suratthaniensis TaxID=1502841 RepID=A0ABS3LHE4_9PROT|nr:hypothetical protein [Acetobacter suratthaniensis]MBO1327002.1 hypothetical protein [Acetobacter suratthaniensis]MCX2565388.1 hypothetical protein [Acetobacter suratthaniensis]